MILRAGFSFLLAVLAVSACTVEEAPSMADKAASGAPDPAAQLTGRWACESVQQSDGQAISIVSAETYEASGKRSSKGALKTAFQGIEISMDLRSTGTWSLDGNTLATRTTALDIQNFKASGSYANFLPLDELERELRNQMRASVRNSETDYAEIKTLTESQMVIVGTSNAIRTNCTR